MPGMDGPTTIKFARKEGFSGLIIGLTAIDNEDEYKELLKAGGNAVLVKPLDMTLFKEILKNPKSYSNKMPDEQSNQVITSNKVCGIMIVIQY